MARRNKMEPEDDRYSEESLNDVKEESSIPYNAETEDTLPELGEADRYGGFARLNDRENFGDMRN